MSSTLLLLFFLSLNQSRCKLGGQMREEAFRILIFLYHLNAKTEKTEKTEKIWQPDCNIPDGMH